MRPHRSPDPDSPPVRRRAIRRAGAIACSLASLLFAAGCSGPAAPPQKPPAPAPPPQVVERDAPFIVDWDPKQIASLAAAVQSPAAGAVVVAFQGDAVRLLPDCHLSGVYAPSAIGMYRGLLQVRRGDSPAPAAGAREGALQQISTVANAPQGAPRDYRFVVVGRHHLGTSRTSARLLDLAERTSDGCRGATHFVRAALTGAFEQEGDPRLIAGLGAGGAGAPAQGAPAPLAKAGDFTQCLLAGSAVSPACSAFLKIELTALLPVHVSLQVVSFSLQDPSAAGLQLRFRSKDQVVAEAPPPTAATPGAAGQVLPAVDITEDVPLVVEVVQQVKGRAEVVASGQVTPADVRRAVFQVALHGTRTGTLQLAASQATGAP